MMFLSDVQSLQIDLVCACGLVSIARRAGSGEPGASPPAQYPAAQVTEEADPQQYRPAGICRVVPLGTRYSARSDNHKAADADPVASCRFPLVLAVEIEPPGRPAKDSVGGCLEFDGRDSFRLSIRRKRLYITIEPLARAA